MNLVYPVVVLEALPTLSNFHVSFNVYYNVIYIAYSLIANECAMCKIDVLSDIFEFRWSKDIENAYIFEKSILTLQYVA